MSNRQIQTLKKTQGDSTEVNGANDLRELGSSSFPGQASDENPSCSTA